MYIRKLFVYGRAAEYIQTLDKYIWFMLIRYCTKHKHDGDLFNLDVK